MADSKQDETAQSVANGNVDCGARFDQPIVEVRALAGAAAATRASSPLPNGRAEMRPCAIEALWVL